MAREMAGSEEKKFRWVAPLLARLFMLLLIGGIVGVVLATFVGQDMSSVRGREPVPRGEPVSNILSLVKSAVTTRTKVEITEEQVNQFLQRRLVIQQGGPLANFGVEAKGVWVRFHEEKMEVIIERSVFGQVHTLSVFVTFSNELNEFGEEIMVMRRTGGRYGRINVAPGFLIFIQPGFDRIVDSMRERLLTIVGEMQTIEFQDGRAILDPTLDTPGFQ